MRAKLLPAGFVAFVVLVALLLGVLPGEAGAGDQPAPKVVTIRGHKFLVNGQEQELRIKAGDSVVWENDDAVSHTATSDDGGQTFDTGPIRAGGKSAPVTFSRATTVEYICTPHPSMKGTIVVEPAE